MPIDPSIPLQVKQFHVPSAQEMMSLQDVATRNQLNQTTLQEKQLELGKRNALLDLAQQPGMVGPDGSPTSAYIAGAMRIAPDVGAGLAKDAITLQTLRNQMDTKVTDVKRGVGEGALQTFNDALKRGMDKDAAWIYAKGETLKNIDSNIASGSYSGIPEQVRQKLRQLPDSVETLMTQVRTIGGKVPEPDETPFAKELRAANIRPGTPEYDKAMKAKVAKDTAPPQTLLMMSGQLDIPPETAKFVAQQYLSGDKAAAQGFARNARARSQIATAITEEAKAQGMTAKDAANAMAEFEGQKAGQRTLGTRQAQIELAANVTKQFAPIAIAASEKYGRSDIKSVNDLQKAVQSRAASPELRQFNFANLSLINAYARAINPQGVGNESDKAHAREVLDTGFSKGDYKAAVAQLQTEIDAELKAPGAVKKGMKEFFTGKKGEETAPKGGFDDADKERRYQEWKAKQGG